MGPGYKPLTLPVQIPNNHKLFQMPIYNTTIQKPNVYLLGPLDPQGKKQPTNPNPKHNPLSLKPLSPKPQILNPNTNPKTLNP